MTRANKEIVANCERGGLKRFAMYPTANSARQHALVAASQRLLLAQPLARERGSANGAPSASAMRNDSASIDPKKIKRSANVPVSKATHVRRYFGEEFGSLFMLHNE